MSKPKYPHRITVAVTEEMYKGMKREMSMRYALGSITKNDYDSFVLNCLTAMDDGETNPIFLKSVKEV